MCREKARALNVDSYMTFRGTVNVRELLGEFDILVLPSYNEGQPIVVLEAMTAGIPTVGTAVGGMEQLIDDPLTTPGGHTWGPCGHLVVPDYVVGMADGLEKVMSDVDQYERYSINARGRVADFFQLEDAMGSYNRLYRELAALPVADLDEAAAAQRDPLAAHDSPAARGAHAMQSRPSSQAMVADEAYRAMDLLLESLEESAAGAEPPRTVTAG